jgi:predicted permease
MPLRRDEVSDEYFETLGVTFTQGRAFTPNDHAGAPPVAVVNESMARWLWPDAPAVGRRFKLAAADADAAWFTVVGVVQDMRRQGLETDVRPQMFEPLAQNPSRLATLLVRTTSDDPLPLAGDVRRVVGQVDTRVSVYGVTTLERRLGGYLAQRRLETVLVTGFATVALLVAAIGLYGLVRMAVAARTREIAIRMAVGASAADVLRLVVRESTRLVAAGLVVGLAAAAVAARAASGLLFGITPADPWTFATVVIVLLSAATAAVASPAWKATRVDPGVALREG